MEHKLSVYADDILFYVVDPHVSLPNLIGELSAYGEVSNFQINYAKSEILLGFGLLPEEIFHVGIPHYEILGCSAL